MPKAKLIIPNEYQCLPLGHSEIKRALTWPTVSLGSQSIVTANPSRLANRNRKVILLGSYLKAGRFFFDDEVVVTTCGDFSSSDSAAVEVLLLLWDSEVAGVSTETSAAESALAAMLGSDSGVMFFFVFLAGPIV